MRYVHVCARLHVHVHVCACLLVCACVCMRVCMYVRAVCVGLLLFCFFSLSHSFIRSLLSLLAATLAMPMPLWRASTARPLRSSQTHFLSIRCVLNFLLPSSLFACSYARLHTHTLHSHAHARTRMRTHAHAHTRTHMHALA